MTERKAMIKAKQHLSLTRQCQSQTRPTLEAKDRAPGYLPEAADQSTRKGTQDLSLLAEGLEY